MTTPFGILGITMTPTTSALSPMSCRAARMLLNLTQPELAERAGVSVSTLRRFEAGTGKPGTWAIRQLEEALEREGILFVGAGAEPRLK
ncbi:helix-turn-helix domain-containing protein [Novosphingobium marinum]|nr:helix-turn-helix transcriptional regulator [Novosphingobium marinum]